VRRILHLHPVFAAAATICAIEVLRDDALETHVAGDLEQHVTDVALLIFGEKDAVDRLRQELREGGLPSESGSGRMSLPSPEIKSKA
jgi:hypothetical protein